ncbi:MAG: OmpA family protein [Spirochaetes bacterium]|nr:OmpA family protein [Spirochaetota bacterium]
MRTAALKSIFPVLMLVFGLHAHAQDSAAPILSMEGAHSVVERSDWHRYVNGSYVGLVSREVRGTILPNRQDDGSFLHHGNFMVMESLIHNSPASARIVDAVVPVSFQIHENGNMAIENDQGFPRLRGFPVFPSRQMAVGTTWTAPGYRAADPNNTGRPLIIPILAQYEYMGIEVFQGEPVHRIAAMFTNRYNNSGAAGDSISRVQGNHRVDILIRVSDGLPVFMRDVFDVRYFMANGSDIRLRGFNLTFGSVVTPMDRGSVIASLGGTLDIETSPAPFVPEPVALPPAVVTAVPEIGPLEIEEALDLADAAIDVAAVPEGIRLTVRNIRFAPDSAEFLPEEGERLDRIAEALAQIPGRNFLVEGHTAATGRPAGEMELSLQRSLRMIDEMARRGIPANRFISKGWGGTKPVGDNATAAGRSVNRRVEITILE